MHMFLLHMTGEPHIHGSQVLITIACVGVVAGITWLVLDRY